MQLIYNGRFYTQDSENPTASAIIVDQGRIIAIGDNRTIFSNLSNKTGDRTQYPAIDLKGRTVVPGLTDAHIHLEYYALGLQKVDCETATRPECLQRIAERARNSPPDSWILGHGWNQNRWSEGFGSAADLDVVTPDNPVYLTAKSLHAAWANSAALRLANITDVTPDPVGGKLGRDKNGTPDGILFESAMTLVEKLIPEPTIEEAAEAIRLAQPILWKMGLTGVHDFDRRRCFSALQILHQRDQLKLRVVKSIPLEDLEHAVALGLRTGFGDVMLRIGGIKAFADGALGPQTAAMLQPYNLGTDNLGMLLLDGEELFEHGRRAVKNGLSLAVHAIGDRANHEVIKAFDQLRDFEADLAFGGSRLKAIQSGLRHRIEHVQVIHPDDSGRLADLGIVASMQPLHATSDMSMADRFWGDRAAFSYAWKTQIAHGAVLVFGSDAPVESPDPFLGIHAAVTRQQLDGTPGPQGWYPNQRLQVHEALHAYTIGAAFAGLAERSQGRIVPGYLADLVVLNENPFTCSPDQIHKIHSVATMVGGEWVLSEL